MHHLSEKPGVRGGTKRRGSVERNGNDGTARDKTADKLWLPVAEGPDCSYLHAALGSSAVYTQKGMGDQTGVVRQGLRSSLRRLSGKILSVETHPCEKTTGSAVAGTHLIVEATADGPSERLTVETGPIAAPTSRLFEGDWIVSVSRRGLFGRSLKAGSCGILCSLFGRLSRASSRLAENERPSFLMHPVGRVERKDKSVHLRILDEYRDALLGLDGYSHIFVLYWFDRNDAPGKRRILRVHPRGNQANPLTGVFACRAPVRPNLIGLTLCKVLSVADGRIRVDKIDALDGSPIVDIKPYIPAIDSTTEDLRIPAWLQKADPV